MRSSIRNQVVSAVAVTVFLAVTAGGTCFAQAPKQQVIRATAPLAFPDTPAGKLAGEYVKAFNAGEEAWSASSPLTWRPSSWPNARSTSGSPSTAT